jgi:hypothetical protein
MFIVHNKLTNQIAIIKYKSGIASFLNLSNNGVMKIFNQKRFDTKKFSIYFPDFVDVKYKKSSKIKGFSKKV